MRHLGRVAAALAGLYAAILIVDPMLNSRMDALSTHPEDYARASLGLLVNVSYLAFGIALSALAVALLSHRRLRAAPAVLLLPPSLLCVVLAAAPPEVARSGAWVSFAILGLAVAPLAVSLANRAVFGGWRPALLAVAVLVAAAFVALVAAPESVSGLVNRTFDVLAASWVAGAGLAVRHVP